MFNKAVVISKGKSKIDLHKSNSLINHQNTNTKAELHNSGYLKAKIITQHDYFTIQKIKFNTNIGEAISFTSNEIKKGEETNAFIQNNFNNQKSLNIFNISKNAYIKALRHYCFYDIILEDEMHVTIKFLPISTSDKKVLCGLHKFNKVFVYSNGCKNFYITRILFQKTMSKEDFNKWINNKEYLFQGDINARKIIFNEVQKDLDKNQYSLLKDSDLKESNIDFFTSDLPKVKFKFTDFIE